MWPTLEEAIEFSGSVPMIEVETEASEVHKVGSKYRCRWFYVVGEAKA